MINTINLSFFINYLFIYYLRSAMNFYHIFAMCLFILHLTTFSIFLLYFQIRDSSEKSVPTFLYCAFPVD